MKRIDSDKHYEPNKSRMAYLTAIAIFTGGALLSGCSSDNDETTAAPTNNLVVVEPPPLKLTGTTLACDSGYTLTDVDASTLSVVAPDSIPDKNVSFDAADPVSNANPNAANNLKRMYALVTGTTAGGTIAYEADGTTPIGNVHPLLVSYAEQVVGPYELGDGSADIGDPTTLDDIFVSVSMDNGATWKKEKVGDTANKSSIAVTWAGTKTDYNGHSHKPTMAVKGNNVLVAWHDKYCPSGNPFNLEDPTTEDYFKVNGAQGSIDYAGLVAPNGKTLYEVPFSCVWTARGVLTDPEVDGTYTIQWRQAQQLTSGTRDANKVWIAAEDVGFALTWQEDTEGLRSGKGAGPGEGYSGATTNHGTDIWYTYIPMADFADVCTDNLCTATTEDPAVIAAMGAKPKPAVNYAYATRITNNETCSPGDTKLYCANHCIATVEQETGNVSGETVQRCVQNDLDYMTPDSTIAPAPAVLDGDTGASRPALVILKTEANEYVSILAYEETKGLSDSDPGVPNSDDPTVYIAMEGKAVYFESFLWDKPVEVSAGRIVNLRVPEATVDDVNNTYTLTGQDIYENARRVVIATQVDACEMGAGDFTFGLMYKQGYSTQGDPSDMYIRMNKGFSYEDFEDTATNVSARETVYDVDGKVESISWTTENLDDMSYENAIDNTFSPRAFLRGEEIYTAFEYTPNWRQTANGTTPNNFWIHRYVDDGGGIMWQGPQQVTFVKGAMVSTLDPRFFPTPETIKTNTLGLAAPALPSDASNPNVLFITYGTFDMETGEELDLFYSRSTDKGATWEYFDGVDSLVAVPGLNDIVGDADDAYRHAKLAGKLSPLEEKEVQSLVSPDGSLLFNAWLHESTTPCASGSDAAVTDCGLESSFGLVPYVAPVIP